MIAHSILVLLGFAGCIATPFFITTPEKIKIDPRDKEDSTDAFFMRR